MLQNHTSYFKQYRNELGFTTQKDAKDFLVAKNIPTNIDYQYIDHLNERIAEIIRKINSVIHSSVKQAKVEDFITRNIFNTYDTIKKNEIIPLLNNQGRRPEKVLFSWLRGFAISEYFTLAISKIFDINIDSILKIGDDDFRNIETFKRTPQADLQIKVKNKEIRIEIQAGFQGINDIKQHKVNEAKKVFNTTKICTLCIHVDLYNGQVGFIRLDSIKDNDINWVTRVQMEGQTVFSIDQNYFEWRLLDPLPKLSDLSIAL